MAGALSHYSFVVVPVPKALLDYDYLLPLSASDSKFSKPFASCLLDMMKVGGDYLVTNMFLYFQHHLCIPTSPLRQQLKCEFHSLGLAARDGHYQDYEINAGTVLLEKYAT